MHVRALGGADWQKTKREFSEETHPWTKDTDAHDDHGSWFKDLPK